MIFFLSNTFIFLVWSQNVVCFALALTVSEINTFHKNSRKGFFKVTWPQIKFLDWVILKFRPFHSSAYRFQDKHISAKTTKSEMFSFKYFFFLGWSHDQKWNFLSNTFFPWVIPKFRCFAPVLTVSEITLFPKKGPNRHCF